MSRLKMADYISETENETLETTTSPSTSFSELEDHGHNYTEIIVPHEDIISFHTVQIMFCLIYATIFIFGIFGNVLVCFVVGRNKAMQTVTNFLIVNLSLADILLCGLAVPFTPLYSFLQNWMFGNAMCRIVPCAQGTSIYISTLTNLTIALDRFFVILYPFKPRMKIITCTLIIISIWTAALIFTLPYGIFLRYKKENDTFTCEEAWPNEEWRQIFSFITALMQFVIPSIVISFCYVKVSLKLSDRARSKPGSKNSKKEAIDRERKRKTNRMLIAIVTIFLASWMPLTLVNFLNDVFMDIDAWEYYNLCFLLAHAIAMSSTCYNPFVYAWLNENFRKEFKQVLPCFFPSRVNGRRSKRCLSEKTCNGNETVQESVLPTTSKLALAGSGAAGNLQLSSRVGDVKILETIEDQISNSNSQTPDNDFELKATYCSTTNQVEIHLPQGGEDISCFELDQQQPMTTTLI